MDKIVVTNTAIIVNNYEPGDCTKLENFFRIYEPITHSYRYIGMYYDKDNKRLYLPRGLDVWYVENLLGESAKILRNQYNPYYVFDENMIDRLPRDDVQKKALRFMLCKGEYTNLETKSQFSVNLATGKGKTYLTIATILYYGIRGIVIASRVGWLEQWRDRTLEYTNMDSKGVYMISGSKNISRLMGMTPKQLARIRIFLVTHDTLRNYAEEHGWETIGDLFTRLGIGIKIYDEAHLDFQNLCMIDYFTNVWRTYYLTATPGKSNDDENKIYKLSFKNVPSIDLFDENNDPHTKYIAVFFNSKPTPGQISSCKNKYGLDRNKYTDYVIDQPEFHKLATVILNLTNNLAPDPRDKILIYIGTNNAIFKFKEWAETNYPELQGHIGIYTSVMSKEEKEDAKRNKRIILSTTKSAGAALDIYGLKITICLAEPYKSEIIAKQSLGRTRDANTFYFDIIDTAFNTCRKFYYKKLPIFDKYALDCSKVSLPPRELDIRYNSIIAARHVVPKVRLFSHVSPMHKERLFSYSKSTRIRLFSHIN